jgi:uncharacterized protein
VYSTFGSGEQAPLLQAEQNAMIEGSSPMGGSPHGDTSRFPKVYSGVDDINAATDKVRSLGGRADDPVTIPAGAFVNCTDDQGVVFSLFEAGGR